MADTLAWALVAGGIWNCLAEWLNRQAGLTPGLGTIGQTNNYADYLSLAAASLIYLRGRARLSFGLSVFLLLILACGLNASASRSVWLYLVALVILAGYGLRHSEDPEAAKRVCVSACLLVAFYVLGQILITVLQALGLWEGVTSGQRLANEVHGTSARLHIWKVAWNIFLDLPWLGAGFGQFDWQYFMQAHRHPDMPVRVEHAHNLVLHLLAELGLVSVILLAIFIVPWCWRIARTPWQPAQGWIAALISIIGLHSLLEYPLWYAYFLGPTAILLGMGESRSFNTNQTWLFRVVLVSLLTIGFVASYNTLIYYRMLEPISMMRDRLAIIDLTRVIRSHSPLMAPYAELSEAHAFELNPKNLDEKIALTDKAMRFWPSRQLVFHQSAYLTWAGRNTEANELLSRALVLYPEWAILFAKNLRLQSSAQDRAKLGPLIMRIKSELPEICKTYLPELVATAQECQGNLD